MNPKDYAHQWPKLYRRENPGSLPQIPVVSFCFFHSPLLPHLRIFKTYSNVHKHSSVLGRKGKKETDLYENQLFFNQDEISEIQPYQIFNGQFT